MAERSAPWRASAESGVRRLAPITLAGAVLGVLVGGVGGRLAMGLLARLNPSAAGLTSDDGFTIGQFTLAGSLQLLGASLQLGLIGAAVYAALRFMLIGPRWFQVLSMSAGPGVVLGAIFVHTEGVDFTELGPTWVAIALFVVIPAVYGALMTLLAERWLGPERWFARAPFALVAAVLVLWVPLLPLLPVIVVVWAAVLGLRRWSVSGSVIAHPSVAWVGRAALFAAFCLAIVDLARDARFLA